MLPSQRQGMSSPVCRGASASVLRVPTCIRPKFSPCMLRSPARQVLAAAAQQPAGDLVVGAPAPEGPSVQAIFGQIERAVQNTFNNQAPGQRNDWKEVEGAWVLYPPNNREPTAVVHFLGGAFVGAAPQISYRLFLEALSNRDVLVIATPYTTSFDNLRTADEAQFKFDKAIRTLGTEAVSLPVYGVGHSLGATIHLLISSRYAVARSGNAFMAFNTQDAQHTIPFLSPIIAPGARMLGPILTQIAASPARTTVESVLDTVRNISPSLLRQVAPLLEQLAPLYLDVSQGRQEFSPTPEEAKNLIRTYYSVPRNLLLRFKEDSLDDTNTLAATLQGSPAVAEMLDLSVRTLPGDHLRPMHQALVDLPPDVARLANQAVYAGGDAIGRLADVATQMGVGAASGPLNELGKGVSNFAGFFGGEVGGPLTDSMQSLADEVAAWMGTGSAVLSGGKALPAKSVYEDRPQFNNIAPRSPSRTPSRTPSVARDRSTSPTL